MLTTETIRRIAADKPSVYAFHIDGGSSRAERHAGPALAEFGRQGMARLLLASIFAALAAAHVSAAPDDLDALARSLVNEARAENGLSPLDWGPDLANAAQAHAEDMLKRDYYSHVTPEGMTVRDRFLDAGGSRWELVAENIARCEKCATPVDVERLRRFHQGWMRSEGHRANILGTGFSRFGFGLASDDGVAYAVQTFAGAGTPPHAAPGETLQPVSHGASAARALEAVNDRRAAEGLPALLPSEALSAAARAAAERAEPAGGTLALPDDTFGLLPDGSDGWSRLAVAAAACGGCGAEVAAGDGAYFAERLAADAGAADFSHFGFAIKADGSGRKTAVAVYGSR